MIGRFKCILVDNIYSAEVEKLIEKRWYSDPEKDGQEGSIYIYIYMFKLLLKKRNWKKDAEDKTVYIWFLNYFVFVVQAMIRIID